MCNNHDLLRYETETHKHKELELAGIFNDVNLTFYSCCNKKGSCGNRIATTLFWLYFMVLVVEEMHEMRASKHKT